MASSEIRCEVLERRRGQLGPGLSAVLGAAARIVLLEAAAGAVTQRAAEALQEIGTPPPRALGRGAPAASTELRVSVPLDHRMLRACTEYLLTAEQVLSAFARESQREEDELPESPS